MHRGKRRRYPITRSARTSKFSETVTPRTFAVLRLNTRSNLVGCCTGNSAVFSPARIFLHKWRPHAGFAPSLHRST
jgi:hypothetical protein